MTPEETYRPAIDRGEATITIDRAVQHQQGSWKWQKRLCTATYVARQSPDGAWRWWSLCHGPSFSGGNLRSRNRWDGDGSMHRKLLDATALHALAVVRQDEALE